MDIAVWWCRAKPTRGTNEGLIIAFSLFIPKHLLSQGTSCVLSLLSFFQLKCVSFNMLTAEMNVYLTSCCCCCFVPQVPPNSRIYAVINANCCVVVADRTVLVFDPSFQTVLHHLYFGKCSLQWLCLKTRTWQSIATVSRVILDRGLMTSKSFLTL